MDVDEKEFFREATLRICGSLEIEKALWNCFMYVREFIPAQQAFLTYHDPNLGVVKVLAAATTKGGRRTDLQVHIPTEVRTPVVRGELPDVIVVDRAETHPIFKYALDVVDRNSSVLAMRLLVEGNFVGALHLLDKGPGRYTQEHARLLALLNDPCAIALSNTLRHQEVLELKDLLTDDNRYLQGELRRLAGEEVIGAEFGLKGVMEMVRQVAPLSSPVLLLGETGTGKEVIASAIHNRSPRNVGPFIKVNCGAIPETLMDSELFGHERGAFTGALSQKRGRFERAHGGTIFLDEIGELPLEAQVRLLRVLQEKEIERVGGTRSIKVDIRVIAATHRDLEAMLKQSRFREDLYFRLKVFPIAIPPLRERMADLPALLQYFMQRKSREMGLRGIPSLATNALDRLMAYHWPGNVRELENAVERALILSKGNPLTFNDLKVTPAADAVRTAPLQDEQTLQMDVVMSRHIRQVLTMTGGRVEGEKGAARLLGIKPNTLRHRMTKLGIPFGRKART
jgi:transcriptional regulator with GAF, ATPase, and Fis domain